MIIVKLTLRSKGGCEGGGEEHYVVLKVTIDNKSDIIKIDGWYMSYDGAYLDMDTTHSVKPIQKTITVYE